MADPANRSVRRSVWAALALSLLLVGAGLFIAIAPDHSSTAPNEPPVDAAVHIHVERAEVPPPSHEHHIGAEWTPPLAQRLQPANPITLLHVISARYVHLGPTDCSSPNSAPATVGGGLTALGVLRL